MKGFLRNILALALAAWLLAGAVGATAPEIGQGGEVWTLRAPTLAQAPDGALWAAWVAASGDDWEIVASRQQGEQWTPLTVVAANPGRWDATPSLAFDAEGVAWLAWSSSTGTDDTLHLSRWTGEGWSKPFDLPTGDVVSHRQPALAAVPGGGLWLAWVGFDGVDDEIYAAFWDGAAWSAPQRVSADDARPEDYDTQPRLAVGPGGEVWLAWAGHQALYDTEVYASRWDGGRWSAERLVSADDATPDVSPALAVDAQGQAWLAWQGWSDAPDGPQARIFVSTRSATGDWASEEPVSSPLAARVYESQPSLALDAQGQPHLAWAVAGSPSGLGYTAFDGQRWLAPAWAARGVQADELVLLFDPGPQVYWPAGLPLGGELLHHRALNSTLSPLDQDGLPPAVEDVVINRHLAFGDSITWGEFEDPPGTPIGPYPARLEASLDYRVVASEVVNRGQPSEKTGAGMHRLKEEELPTYRPNFVEIMEGTNDVTHLIPYDSVAYNLQMMIYDAKQAGAKPMLSTLIPRRDPFYDETQEMNSYIVSVATQKGVPLADNWSAFHASGDWEALYVDHLHPNSQGMQILADTFYAVILDSYSWLTEETEPPTTWISSLPAQTPCGQTGVVSWTGTDNLSWVVSYDVQMQLDGGAWTDWLMATAATSAPYSGSVQGNSLGFRVRGRDLVGNQSNYSAAQYTIIGDDTPPYDVQVGALAAVVKPPFQVRWWAADACGTVVKYDVEYHIGAGAWLPWLSGVPATSAIFGDDETVQYGQTYSFRVRAYDAANNWAESAPVSTLLAQYVVSGQTFNVRHEPLIRPQASLAPEALAVQPIPAGYTAYLAGAGAYDISITHDGFGSLPPMRAVPVTGDVAGLDFVLPPLDDVVDNGGLEAGGWGDWLPGGDLPPTLIAEAHTGDGAVRLGGSGGAATLSQALSAPGDLSRPALSFLVRLDDGGSGSSTLHVELAGAALSHTYTISTETWTHVWLPVEAAVGQAVTLTFSLSDTPAIRLDEVSLGSAAPGGYRLVLPLVQKQ